MTALALLVLAVTLAPSQAQDAGGRPAALARVPLRRANGLVHVELARAGGEPLSCLLDTGANRSAIDPRRAEGLPVVETVAVLGTTGALQAETVRLAGLHLGTCELPELVPTRRDLGGLLALGGRPIDMILGTDAFPGRALTLDFARDELELHASPTAAAADDVPMVLDQGIPTLPATLGEVETVLRIDTGASLFATRDTYVNVPPALWRRLASAWPELAPESHLQGTGASGERVDLAVYRLPGALIGPRELASVCVVVQPEAGYFAAPDARGFVGNNFLEKLGRVTLDFGTGRFRVELPAAPR